MIDSKTAAQVPLLASIGHVCLQWALLEMTVLSVIYTLEGISYKKGEIIYGGLDMIPRFNLAINLAEFHNAPLKAKKELRAIRKEIQTGIADKRNQAVHGVHADAEVIDAIKLVMPRWKGDRKTETVTLEDLIKLTNSIYALHRRSVGVEKIIAKWKFGDHLSENAVSQIPETNASPFLKFAQRLYSRIKHLFRWKS